VAGRGRVSRLDGHHRRLHEALEELADLFVQHDVLDGLGRLAAEREQQLLVFAVEGPVDGVERLEHAHHLTVGVAHRHAEDALGAVAVLQVPVALEPRVLVGVEEVDELAALGDGADDALAQRHADLSLDALGHPAPQLAPLAIEDEQRATVGLEHPGRLMHDER